MTDGFKRINAIRTRIVNGELIALLDIEGTEDLVIISPFEIRRNTGLQVNELELLVDSTIRINIYKKNEETINDKADIEDDIIIEYWFNPKKPIDILRIENKSYLLPFQEIKEIWSFNRREKLLIGIKTKGGRVIYLDSIRFTHFTKLEVDDIDLLIGSYVYPEYYNAGDRLPSGGEVLKNNCILYQLVLRYRDPIEKIRGEQPIWDDDYESSSRSKRRYSEYGGPNDGYGGQLDDDFINDALGGDPEAYWNID